ncbi:MAG: MFS transporter [Pseudomonadota bacterium]
MNPIVVILAFAAFVSLGLPDGVLGPSWPSMHLALGVALEALGTMATAMIGGYLLSSSLSGVLLRTVSLGAVLSLSTAGASVAVLGIGLTQSWPVLLLCAVLGGMSGGAIDAGLNAYGAVYFSRRMMNWLHAAFGVGSTIGPLVVAGVLASDLSWRWSYGAVGATQALLAVAFVVTRRRFDRVEAEGAAQARAAPATATLRLRQTWFGIAAFFFYAGLEFATAQWSYSLFVLERGAQPATAGLVVALYWGALAAGRVVAGFVADRVDPVHLLRLCLTGVCLSALLLWLRPLPGSDFVGLVLIGGLLAPVFATLISLTPARVGRAHSDTAIGFQISAAAVGGAAVTVAVGAGAARFGLEAAGPILFGTALLLLAAHEVVARAARVAG